MSGRLIGENPLRYLLYNAKYPKGKFLNANIIINNNGRNFFTPVKYSFDKKDISPKFQPFTPSFSPTNLLLLQSKSYSQSRFFTTNDKNQNKIPFNIEKKNSSFDFSHFSQFNSQIKEKYDAFWSQLISQLLTVLARNTSAAPPTPLLLSHVNHPFLVNITNNRNSFINNINNNFHKFSYDNSSKNNNNNDNGKDNTTNKGEPNVKNNKNKDKKEKSSLIDRIISIVILIIIFPVVIAYSLIFSNPLLTILLLIIFYLLFCINENKEYYSENVTIRSEEDIDSHSPLKVTSLNVRMNNKFDLNSINKFINLEELDIYCYEKEYLSSLPDIFNQLPKLKKIVIKNSLVSAFPPSFNKTNLPELKSIAVEKINYINIDNVFLFGDQLEELILSFSYLSSRDSPDDRLFFNTHIRNNNNDNNDSKNVSNPVNSYLDNFIFKEKDIHNNDNNNINDDIILINKLTKLKKLVITGANLEVNSPIFSKLELDQIEVIDLSSNRISSLPENFLQKTTNLRSLNLSCNYKLNNVPNLRGDQLANLQILSIEYTNVNRLPSEYFSLESLTELCIGGSRSSPPFPSTSYFPKLKFFECHVGDIPDIFHHSPDLEKLVFQTEVSSIPPSLLTNQFEKVIEIRFPYKSKSLPDIFDRFPNARKLDLGSVSSFPPSFNSKNLFRVRELKIRISTLPSSPSSPVFPHVFSSMSLPNCDNLEIIVSQRSRGSADNQVEGEVDLTSFPLLKKLTIRNFDEKWDLIVKGFAGSEMDFSGNISPSTLISILLSSPNLSKVYTLRSLENRKDIEEIAKLKGVDVRYIFQ